MSRREKTMNEAFEEAGEAWGTLVMEICYTLRIDRACGWLEGQLRKFRRGAGSGTGAVEKGEGEK